MKKIFAILLLVSVCAARSTRSTQNNYEILGCECVPYYQCNTKGTMNDDGEDIIDIRNGFMGTAENPQTTRPQCGHYLSVCCLNTEMINGNDVSPAEPPVAGHDSQYPSEPPTGDNGHVYPTEPPTSSHGNEYPTEPPHSGHGNEYPTEPPHNGHGNEYPTEPPHSGHGNEYPIEPPTNGHGNVNPTELPNNGQKIENPTEPPTSGQEIENPTEPPTAGHGNVYPTEPPTSSQEIENPTEPPTNSNGNEYPTQAPTDGQENGYPTKSPTGEQGNGYPNQPPIGGHGNGYPKHPPTTGQGNGYPKQPPIGGHGNGYPNYPPVGGHGNVYPVKPPIGGHGNGYPVKPPTGGHGIGRPNAKPHVNKGCGYRNPNGIGFKITGNFNNEANFAEFPWMVAILKQINYEGKLVQAYQCGGSLIHPSVILTAAHCVHGKSNNELTIRAGEWDTQTVSEALPHQDRSVSAVITHPLFNNKNLHNDFALLILNKPVDLADNVEIVCLPKKDEYFDHSNCFATGWGKNEFGDQGQYQVILKAVELPTVPNDHCQYSLRQTRLGKYFKLNRSFMCAGGVAGIDTCTGDGGSPLVCPLPHDPTRYVQAGIVAWGIGCGKNGVPGVYGNVAQAREWIDEQLASYNIDSSTYTPGVNNNYPSTEGSELPHKQPSHISNVISLRL